MSSRSSPREPEAWFVRALRTAALTAVVAGAAASLGLMVRAGSRQRSIVLILLFGMLSGFRGAAVSLVTCLAVDHGLHGRARIVGLRELIVDLSAAQGLEGVQSQINRHDARRPRDNG
jgi:hypothetical protein